MMTTAKDLEDRADFLEDAAKRNEMRAAEFMQIAARFRAQAADARDTARELRGQDTTQISGQRDA